MVYKGIEQSIEDTINSDPEMHERYFTDCKLQDFNVGDYVKCTYIPGFFEIVEIRNKRVHVKYVTEEYKEVLDISPSFLKKVKNGKWLKVLYGD